MAVPQERTLTYCSLDTLRARGWTPLLVRTFLGEPDRTVPVRLYLTPRVREAERRPDFVEARALRQRRARALRAANARRREEGLAAVRAAPMRLPELPERELAARAVRHRNLRDAERAARSWGHRPRPASVGTALPADLARWKVDYLSSLLDRHRVLLDALPAGSRAEGDRLLQERVYAAIAAAYPGLVEECPGRQATRGRG
ncbi:hypothetical protein GCM10009716_29750 [Streptomyces sodiiphilus]|uniref:Uncharacterized protein n=1 Tax=Streptomyces sodiiphilus TaxID=226217 RepID=A0ABP5APH1_9ACTN